MDSSSFGSHHPSSVLGREMNWVILLCMLVLVLLIFARDRSI